MNKKNANANDMNKSNIDCTLAERDTVLVSKRTRRFIDCLCALGEISDECLCALEEIYPEDAARSIFEKEFYNEYCSLKGSLEQLMVLSIKDNLDNGFTEI